MNGRTPRSFFVPPKRSLLELSIFLPRVVRAPQVKRVLDGSAKRRVHVVHVRHRDEVEAPIVDWLREAYDAFDSPGPAGQASRQKTPRPRSHKPERQPRT